MPTKGSFSKELEEVDDSERVTKKFNFAFLQSILDYSKLFGLENIYYLFWNYTGTVDLEMGPHNTSSTQPQNRSFHVVERRRTTTKFTRTKNGRAGRAKQFFIVKHCNL